MSKYYRLGYGKSNIITNYNDKKTILNYLYSNLNLSNYRFQILDNINKLEFLKENNHYVSPNFYGINYLIIFMKLNNKNSTFLIDRRKLKYNQNHIDLKNFLILEVSFDCESYLYNGTIIDGKLININSDKYIFICIDYYYLMGKNQLDINLEKKYEILNKIISTQMGSKPCYNFDFKINKLYNYDKLESLIYDILPKSKLPTNGIIFYPLKSGNNYIYSGKNENIKNTDKTNETNNKNLKENNQSNKEVITNFKENNISSDESYHLVRDLCSYLKSRVNTSINDFTNEKQKEFYLKKSDIIDVYHLYEKLGEKNIGIAHIPNLKISQELYNIFKTEDIRKFNCYYNKQFNKWVPLLD